MKNQNEKKIDKLSQNLATKHNLENPLNPKKASDFKKQAEFMKEISYYRGKVDL